LYFSPHPKSLSQGEREIVMLKKFLKNNFPPLGEIQRGRCIVLTLTLNPSPRWRGKL